LALDIFESQVNTNLNHLGAEITRPDSLSEMMLREVEEIVSADIMGTTLGIPAEDADITGTWGITAATCATDEAKENECMSAYLIKKKPTYCME
jgi:hypothetical protein